jgi:hypothetical protein
MHTACLLWGTKWIFKYYFVEIRLQPSRLKFIEIKFPLLSKPLKSIFPNYTIDIISSEN